MTRAVFLIQVVIGVAIVLVGLRVGALPDKYPGLTSSISMLIAYYSLVFNIYYNRDPRIYGVVNRLWRYIKRDHTYWEFSITFAFEGRTHEERVNLLADIEAKLRAAEFGQVQVTVRTAEHMEITLDGLIGLLFQLEQCRLTVNLDRRLTVPVHAYGEYQRTLSSVAEAIQAVVKPDEVLCDVQVYFRKGEPNPFYGFFVNRVPSRLLEVFHLVFRVEGYPDCRIEASTDHVGVQSSSLTKLFASLDEILSFQALPTVKESE